MPLKHAPQSHSADDAQRFTSQYSPVQRWFGPHEVGVHGG